MLACIQSHLSHVTVALALRARKNSSTPPRRDEGAELKNGPDRTVSGPIFY